MIEANVITNDVKECTRLELFSLGNGDWSTHAKGVNSDGSIRNTEWDLNHCLDKYVKSLCVAVPS